MKLQFNPYIFPTPADYSELYRFPDIDFAKRERSEQNIHRDFDDRIAEEQYYYHQRIADAYRDHQERLYELQRAKRIRLSDYQPRHP